MNSNQDQSQLNGGATLAPATCYAAPSSITEYLARMTEDCDAVRQRLLDAPLGMTGGEEPELWKIISDIKNKLAAARTVWR